MEREKRKSSGLGPTVDFGFPHKKMRLDFKDPATMSSLPEFPNRLSPPAEPSRDSDSPMRIDLLELHLAEAKQQVKALNAELDEKNAEIRSKKAEITFKDERIRLNESLIGLQRNANVFSFAPMQHFPAPKPTKQPIYINDPAAPRWKGPEELRDAILRRMRWTAYCRERDEQFYVSVDFESAQGFYDLFHFCSIELTDHMWIKMSISTFKDAVGLCHMPVRSRTLQLTGRTVEIEWIGVRNRLLVRGSYGLR